MATITTRSPRIKLELSLDGKISNVHVLADSAEDRDRALAKMRQFLPAFELLEKLAVETDSPADKTADSEHQGVKTCSGN